MASTGYLHYIAITTAASQEGSSDSSNFPVCVNTGSSGGCSPLNIASYLAVSGSGGYVQNTVTQTGGNGGTEPADAVFGTGPTCSTLLPWETETYTTTTGVWIAWVQLPTLHHNTQDTFYLCFDRASMTTQQNTGSYAPSAVWNSHFTSIYHLNGVHDSTANGYTLSTQGTAPAQTPSGQIGGAYSFSGAGSFYNLSQQYAPASSFTFSLWLNTANWNVSQAFVQQGTDAVNGWNTSLNEASGCSRPQIQTVFGTAVTIGTCNPFTNSSWHMITVTYVSASGLTTIYADGAYSNSASAINSGRGAPAGTYFGYGGDVAGYFTGLMDEIEISQVALTPDWVTAEYNNQNPSSTFLTAGSLH